MARRRRRGRPNVETARELRLYADNDGGLYRQRTVPIMKNLAKKMKKGTYDPRKAVKLWEYWADDAAKRYCKDHCSSPREWNKIFTKADRRRVARLKAQDFRRECKAGEYDFCESVSVKR